MKDLTRGVTLTFTPSGLPTRNVYVLDPVNKQIVFDHEEDLDKIIQSYANDVAIDRIMERHALGDLTATNSNPGINDINEKQDLDLLFLKDIKDPAQLKALQAHYLSKLYADYTGDKSIMTPEKFMKAILSGDYKSLNIKEEVSDNA